MTLRLKESYGKKFLNSSINEILLNKELAQLGDSYVNFIYSLALSVSKGRLQGKKVPSDVLAEALREGGLRKLLPSRLDRHRLGDAAEALIAYSWITEKLSADEAVKILEIENGNSIEGFKKLLLQIMKKFPTELVGERSKEM
jgi:hypothetical protein